jgi:hypothetical protein
MSKREALIESIENTKYEYSASKHHIKNFIKVFIIDGTAKDCLAKEDSAKIIDNMIKKAGHQDTLFKGIKIP